LPSFDAESFAFPSLSKNLNIKINRSITLPVAVYEFETWSLTLREKYRVTVFKNMVLRRTFGPKRDVLKGVQKTT
jgi:hypothetical protein